MLVQTGTVLTVMTETAPDEPDLDWRPLIGVDIDNVLSLAAITDGVDVSCSIKVSLSPSRMDKLDANDMESSSDSSADDNGGAGGGGWCGGGGDADEGGVGGGGRLLGSVDVLLLLPLTEMEVTFDTLDPDRRRLLLLITEFIVCGRGASNWLEEMVFRTVFGGKIGFSSSSCRPSFGSKDSFDWKLEEEADDKILGIVFTL